ncbi:MAG: DUF4062 domain-containing protein [Planctomycetota bacterium]
MAKTNAEEGRPRSVFVCSRMEELSSSRRACMHAILDSGAHPIIYEAELLPGNPTRVQSRERIDRCLQNSDLLVMLIGETLGEALPEFAGMSAIEYELYRFLYQWYVFEHGDRQGRGRGDREETRRAIDDVFASGHTDDRDSPVASLREQIDRELMALSVQHRLERLSSGKQPNQAFNPTDWGKALVQPYEHVRRAVAETMPFARIFHERVLLCRKRLSGPRPITQDTADFIGIKPTRRFRSAQARGRDAHQRGLTIESVHLNAQHTLYLEVVRWLSDQESPIEGSIGGKRARVASDRSEGVTRGDLEYFRIPSTNEPGFMLEATRHLYKHGYNIDDMVIVVAHEGGVEQRCIVTSAEQVGFGGATPTDTPPIQGADRIEAAEFARLLRGAAHARGSCRFITFAANIPGMLSRIANAIAALRGSIVSLHCLSRDARRRTKRSIDVEWNRDDARDVSRELRHVLMNVMGMYHCEVERSSGANRAARSEPGEEAEA